MQRTTSALTAAVLGAVLTASTALAQQAPVTDDAPPVRTSSTKTKATAGSATEAANAQLYGMSVTRGARYLLRNGLDYLSYQQYDRALKFLREAEVRITDQKTRKVQMELNEAEVTALKQGIEAAQRGLRRASNAESPYALSDKSRPANGFTPAKPLAQLAARGNQTNAMNRQAKATPVAPRNPLASDDDDERAQPVRLASGERPLGDEPAELDPMARAVSNNNSPAPGSVNSDGPANMPEAPQIPLVSRLPDLTAVNGPERLVAADNQQVDKTQLPMGPSPSTAEQKSGAPTPETQVSEQAPALVSQPPAATTVALATLQSAEGHSPVAANRVEAPTAAPSDPATTAEPRSLLPQTLETSPTVVPAFEASTNPKVPDQAPGLPISDGNTGTPGAAATAPSSHAKTGLPTDGPALPAAVSAATESTPKTSVIDLETIPSSAPVEDRSQPAVNSGGAPHQESADAVPVSTSTPVAPASVPNAAPEPSVAPAGAPEVLIPSAASAPVTPASSSTAGPEAVGAASAGASDDLPPLPAELGQSAPDVSVTVTSKPQPTPANVPTDGPAADDALPPLPPEVDRSALIKTESTPSAVQALPANTPGAVPPSTTGVEQPAQPNDGSSVQPSNESRADLPAGAEAQTAPTVAERESIAVPASPVSPASVPPVATPNSVALPESPTTELVPQSSLNATSTSAAAVINSSYPTTNPDQESQPATTAASRIETQADVSSLPPALTGRSLTSSSDPFLPDRANPPSSLKPELQREVERIARHQEEEMRRQAQNPTQPANPPRETIASDLRTQTQMDISRAPSPAEARPIKAIPVPEDWVPLAPRNWAPQRKYWAAAATCHLPLYFQDPVLERYGHSVEQFVGPIGRFLTYPVDDPTQSTQRNQMLQPFFSAGLMGLQIITWPYNLIMDPPWEAQYDLGYYRPGDSIPTDTYWLPLHGYGPPLRGSNY